MISSYEVKNKELEVELRKIEAKPPLLSSEKKEIKPTPEA
jgi:hypothetical protein